MVRPYALDLRERVVKAVDEGQSCRAVAETFDTQSTILTPEQDDAIVRAAGFSNASLFYAGFTFRGWVGYA